MIEPIYTKQHMEVMRDEWKKENAELKERWSSLKKYLEDNAHRWYIGYSGPFDVALCEMKKLEAKQ